MNVFIMYYVNTKYKIQISPLELFCFVLFCVVLYYIRHDTTQTKTKTKKWKLYIHSGLVVW